MQNHESFLLLVCENTAATLGVHQCHVMDDATTDGNEMDIGAESLQDQSRCESTVKEELIRDISTV